MSKPDFFEYLQTELGWPNPGERIFVETRNCAFAARIDDDGPSRQYHMVEGYKEAADILAEAMLSDQVAKYPIIYPLVFCYRHALELMRKYLVNEHGAAAGEKPTADGHDLLRLWKSAHRVIEHFATDEASLTKLDGYFTDLASVDPGSVTFRYASDRANRVYPIGVYYVDVVNLKATMNALIEFLDCAAFGMAASQDIC